MAGRPGRDEICLLENDGLGICRISAWNYKERRNIFTLELRDPIAHVSYSMGGKFIIAARTGRTGILLIDSATGDILQSPQSLAGTVSLAVTGKSERNMLVYFASGGLSYWDLESGNETNAFDAPANLHSPVLFSNSRYLAGLNAKGLMVINAVSGELLTVEESVPPDSLLCSVDNDIICLIQTNNSVAEARRYSIGRDNRLRKNGSISFPAGRGNRRFTAIAANGNTIVLGDSAGFLVLANMNGGSQILDTKEQTRVIDADVSGAAIAFLAENGTLGFIPLNYSLLSSGRAINIERNSESYNHITAFAKEDGFDGQFIFWQDKNTRAKPVIQSSSPGDKKISLGDISLRSPIRLADSYGGRIMFLDSTGNLSVVSPLDGKSHPFTFFSVGLMDAAFADRNRLVIGRSAVSGNTPFLMININTGETVPMPYPSQAVVTMYRGASGSIYAAAISPRSSANDPDSIKTSILQIKPADIANSIKLVDFEGEDTQFSIAESPGGTAGSFAASIGGEEAAIYTNGHIHRLDRSSGLPLRLIDGGRYLISLDRDGCICWHDNQSGKLIAVFRLHPDTWTLQTEERTFSGKINIINVSSTE
jgi:hypothetical protein